MNSERRSTSEARQAEAGDPDAQHWAQVVQQHVQSLRFGSVHVVVHDSRVVSVERIEKFRLPTHIPTPTP